MDIGKVKAFTILEVTITMLVTALLVGVTYTSYSIIIKSYRDYNDKNNETDVLLDLDHVLKRDFERAESVYKNQDGIFLKSGSISITYIFAPGYIVRNSLQADTFKVQTQEIITSFENAPINEVKATEEQNRIDQMGFTLIYKNEQIPYLYHKVYSAVNLIQRNTNAIN